MKTIQRFFSPVASSFDKKSLSKTKQAVAKRVYSDAKQEADQGRINAAQERAGQGKLVIADTKLKHQLVRAGARASLADKLILANADKSVEGAPLRFQEFQMSVPAAIDMFNALLSTGKKSSSVADKAEIAHGRAYQTIASLLSQHGGGTSGIEAATLELLRVQTIASQSDPKLGSIVGTIGRALLSQAQGNTVTGETNLWSNTADHLHLSRQEQSHKFSSMTSKMVVKSNLQLQLAKQTVGVSLTKSSIALMQTRGQAKMTAARGLGSMAASGRVVAGSAAVAGMSVALVGVGATAVAGVAAGAATVVPIVVASNVLLDGIQGGPGIAARAKGIAEGNVRENISILPSQQRVASLNAQWKSVFAPKSKRASSVASSNESFISGRPDTLIEAV